MIVLSGYRSESIEIESHYKQVFKQHDWIDLRDYVIEPCRSCGSCGTKTPGRCIIEDDFEKVAKRVAKADGLVYLSPITFGTYSSLLKYFIDRSMCMGLPLYHVQYKKLLHPMRYDWKTVIGIGIGEDSFDAFGVFEKHVQANALNMQLLFQSHTLTHDSVVDHQIDFGTFRHYSEVI